MCGLFVLLFCDCVTCFSPPSIHPREHVQCVCVQCVCGVHDDAVCPAASQEKNQSTQTKSNKQKKGLSCSFLLLKIVFGKKSTSLFSSAFFAKKPQVSVFGFSAKKCTDCGWLDFSAKSLSSKHRAHPPFSFFLKLQPRTFILLRLLLFQSDTANTNKQKRTEQDKEKEKETHTGWWWTRRKVSSHMGRGERGRR